MRTETGLRRLTRGRSIDRHPELGLRVAAARLLLADVGSGRSGAVHQQQRTDGGNGVNAGDDVHAVGSLSPFAPATSGAS